MQKRVLAFICALLVLVSISNDTFANVLKVNSVENQVTKEKVPAELKKIQKKVEKYLSTSEEGVVYFDEEAALNDGLEEEMLVIGRNLNQFSTAMQINPDQATTRLSIPIYGNWCGPGHSGPAGPIDLLDRLCQIHDYCYANRGYFSCYCDARLEKSIMVNWLSISLSQKAVAAAIYLYFDSVPCNPFV
ncbi:MAG: hypothetical protein ACK5ML_08045 [Lachnospiraceae bacterium]